MLFLLPHAIDRAAAQNPDGEAVRAHDRGLTYAELVRKANALAHLLVDQGVERNDRVGIYLHKSLESAVALWGIMKAGAAYVPLDPATPEDRLSYILRQCGIRHVISEDALCAPLHGYLRRGGALEAVIGVESADALPTRTIPWSELDAVTGDAPPAVRVIEQDLAYIMYTSGSTGPPKGIMHTHRSGLSYAQWAAHEYVVDPVAVRF